MKFRYHRGGFAESSATTIEFENKEELYNILHKELMNFNFDFNIDDLECKYYGYDDRCNWETHLITIKNYGIVGMTDSQI